MSDLLAVAERIEREMICCDVFERLSVRGDWSAADKREWHRHAICYWGAAARALVLDQRNAKPVPTGREPHPATMIGRR